MADAVRGLPTTQGRQATAASPPLVGAVRGELYVREEHDAELNRATRMATIIDPASHKVLAKPLLDVALLSVKPDWWTMTGWERVIEDTTGQTRAYQQSWILIPFDMLSASDRMRGGRA